MRPGLLVVVLPWEPQIVGECTQATWIAVRLIISKRLGVVPPPDDGVVTWPRNQPWCAEVIGMHVVQGAVEGRDRQIIEPDGLGDERTGCVILAPEPPTLIVDEKGCACACLLHALAQSVDEECRASRLRGPVVSRVDPGGRAIRGHVSGRVERVALRLRARK